MKLNNIKHYEIFSTNTELWSSIGSQDHTVAQRLVIQHPTQSKVNCKDSTGCLGLYPVRSWKSPGMETAQSLWAACSTTWLPSGWKDYAQSEPCFNSCMFLFILLPSTALILLISIRKLLLDLSLLFSKLNKINFLLLRYGLAILVALCWTHSS